MLGKKNKKSWNDCVASSEKTKKWQEWGWGLDEGSYHRYAPLYIMSPWWMLTSLLCRFLPLQPSLYLSPSYLHLSPSSVPYNSAWYLCRFNAKGVTSCSCPMDCLSTLAKLNMHTVAISITHLWPTLVLPPFLVQHLNLHHPQTAYQRP